MRWSVRTAPGDTHQDHDGEYRRDSGVIEYARPRCIQEPDRSAGGRHRSRLTRDPARGFPNRCREYFSWQEPHRLGIIDRRRMNTGLRS